MEGEDTGSWNLPADFAPRRLVLPWEAPTAEPRPGGGSGCGRPLAPGAERRAPRRGVWAAELRARQAGAGPRSLSRTSPAGPDALGRGPVPHQPNEVPTNTRSCRGSNRVNVLQLKYSSACETLKKGRAPGIQALGEAPTWAGRAGGGDAGDGRWGGIPLCSPRGRTPGGRTGRASFPAAVAGLRGCERPGSQARPTPGGTARGDAARPTEDATCLGRGLPVPLSGPAFGPGKRLRTRR